MRKSRFTESQIVSILKELDAGTPATELARKHGIHANTIWSWPAFRNVSMSLRPPVFMRLEPIRVG